MHYQIGSGNWTQIPGVQMVRTIQKPNTDF